MTDVYKCISFSLCFRELLTNIHSMLMNQPPGICELTSPTQRHCNEALPINTGPLLFDPLTLSQPSSNDSLKDAPSPISNLNYTCRGASSSVHKLLATTPKGVNIATRCTTLQHASTHCNTLQHTALHCLKGAAHNGAKGQTQEAHSIKDVSERALSGRISQKSACH